MQKKILRWQLVVKNIEGDFCLIELICYLLALELKVKVFLLCPLF